MDRTAPSLAVAARGAARKQGPPSNRRAEHGRGLALGCGEAHISAKPMERTTWVDEASCPHPSRAEEEGTRESYPRVVQASDKQP